MFHQPLDPAARGFTGAFSRRVETKQGPRGLRRSALRAHEMMQLVAGAAFTPSTVRVLHRPQPRGTGANLLAAFRAAGAQASHRQKRPVGIVDTPTSIPTAVVTLMRLQITHAPRDRRILMR